LTGPRDDLDATIAALWREARPRVLARIDVVAQAAAALRAGRLDADLAAHARREAHKLAGALGTFGLPDGTETARAVEQRLEAGPSAADEPALTAATQELRRIADEGPRAPAAR
jgi:HPt (histidine-containing phosphotransfer) domain-containing protein